MDGTNHHWFPDLEDPSRSLEWVEEPTPPHESLLSPEAGSAHAVSAGSEEKEIGIQLQGSPHAEASSTCKASEGHTQRNVAQHTPRSSTEEVELRALESKLELLTIQRQLSSLKSQAFLLELEKFNVTTLSARRHSLDSSTPSTAATPVHMHCKGDGVPFGRPQPRMRKCHSILLASLDSCQAAPSWPRQQGANSAEGPPVQSPRPQEGRRSRNPHWRSHMQQQRTPLSVESNGSQENSGDGEFGDRAIQRCNSSALSKFILPGAAGSGLGSPATKKGYSGCFRSDRPVYVSAWVQ